MRLTGFATALVVGLTWIVGGCGDGSSVLGADGGRVRFVLSSGFSSGLDDAAAPAPAATLDGDHDDDDHYRRFQSANVTFSSILARNLEGVLVNVEMELPATVDVLALGDGNEVTLPEGLLPPATYDQIVVVMTQVEVVTLDGTAIAITPPGGGWTAVAPMCPFVVEDGVETTVKFRFVLGKAFSWRNSRYHFKPRFVCEESEG
jgi:hypothetical protein